MADNRENTLLQAIAEGDEVSEARTTDEVFLKAIADGTEKPEEVRNRLQYWLNQIVGGGGGAVPSYTEYFTCEVGSNIKELVEKAEAEAATSLIWLDFEGLGVRYIVRTRKPVSDDSTLHDFSFEFRQVTSVSSGNPGSFRYNESYEITKILGGGIAGKLFRLGYIRLAA